MSLTSLLGIARSALVTYQRAMTVTAHNVANAETLGYSRQRLAVTPADPLRTPAGLMGRGVTDQGVVRTRDRFLDAAFRHESSLLGTARTLRDLMSQVEAAFAEPSDSGLGSALDGLFHAFSDLAADPASPVNRGLVAQAANRLVAQFHRLDAQISQATQDAGSRLTAEVDEVNSIADQVATLNANILAAGPNHRAPDLEDQRDLLLDRLSALGAVRVTPRADGSVGVMFGDTLLVDGGLAQRLGTQAQAGGGYLITTALGNPVDPQAGSLRALLDLTTTTLPGVRAQLDTLAAAMVTEVNTIHRTGYAATGGTGVDFFDPAGLTAGSISLSAAVAASPSAIAAGATAAPGDARVAQLLALVGTAAAGSLGGKSLRDFYTDLSAAVGTAVQDADVTASAHLALVERAEMQRSSVSGVSIDEEMVNLIGQQQVYQAAARLIRTAEEMLAELMRIV
jgi:flagellar hook-associated protein 1 FlgK